ncbi:uncharacterized protein LOC118349700 [Juglans regia]|uniref:Uncharacterized protein LOC118349700 n=1 Tax=Juglans regia TaxID=51240 RepID=A0A6P9F923_JUGRE|nr:uncharacterized protein LOC118349700 [Juglans regia]
MVDFEADKGGSLEKLCAEIDTCLNGPIQMSSSHLDYLRDEPSHDPDSSLGPCTGLKVKGIGKKSKDRWIAPPVGTLKLNVDGALFFDQQRAGVGALLRDEKGDVLLTACKKEMTVNNLLEIELLAILRGLQLCLHKGIPKLEIETDSLIMANTIPSKEAYSRSMIGNMIKGIQDLMKLFHQCSIQHVGSISNAGAQKLAKYAWHIDDISVWECSFPESIEFVIWVEKYCL